ncbi:SLATT domain-containing protein [Shouchella miscanthi]|uniref:SLATT domain-containing protein n=1 Tax=Shouchella miscanthi TaxID=2598861 RepID=A0ABU6NR93_9BACI|nr:SLATT domain-containing protein [Shouchella miscanthi]
MDSEIKKEIILLKDSRVWVTKKARMEAEARMKFNDNISKGLVSYYTFVVLSFSIATLVIEDSNISLFTVIASVGLFGLSLIVSAKAYKEKAIRYKESYLNLNELEFDLKNLLRTDAVIGSDLVQEFRRCEKLYTDILNRTDNHDDIDYFKTKLKHQMKIAKLDKVKYYFNKTIKLLFLVLLIFFPLILLLIIVFGGYY